MPLNLSVSDAEFTPYLKYNAKAGRFYIRLQGQTSDVEIEKPRLLFDMANVKTGWLYYQEGAGPEKVWDPSPTQMAPRPAGPRKFKRGFEVLVFGNDEIPGVGKIGLREFSSTANNVITSFMEMYNAYEAGMKTNPSKIPFYRCVRVIPVQGAYGTNYEPKFELIGWVERAKCPAFDEMLQSANTPPLSSYQPTYEPDPLGGYDPRSNGSNGIHAPAGGGFGPGPALDDEIPF